MRFTPMRVILEIGSKHFLPVVNGCKLANLLQGYVVGTEM